MIEFKGGAVIGYVKDDEVDIAVTFEETRGRLLWKHTRTFQRTYRGEATVWHDVETGEMVRDYELTNHLMAIWWLKKQEGKAS